MTSAHVIGPDKPFLPLFRRHPVMFERGEGIWLYDADGNAFMDLMAGIAVSLLGHAHPSLTSAIAEQAGKLLHTTNLFHHQAGVDAAQHIVDRIGPGGVFFCNSGTEANEAALKFVRKYAWRNGDSDRTRVAAIDGSFHGRSLGSLSLTIQPAKWEGFGPLPGDVDVVEFDDVDALDATITDRTAAVIIETIQGEIGIKPLSDAFIAAARALTTERGALLIVDEIQTGMGRTGKWWGHSHHAITPDVVTLAKGLGGGVPAGALWAHESCMGAFQPSDHGTTQGGNPLSCAAAVAVFETIERDGLVANAAKVGGVMKDALAELGDVRGEGLLLAVDLGRPVAGDVVKAALANGIVVNDVNATSIRLAPPLIITEDEALEGVGKLAKAIEAVG